MPPVLSLALVLLPAFASACAPLAASEADASGSADSEVEAYVIGEPAGGALLGIRFQSDRPVPIDPSRPIRIHLPNGQTATGAIIEAPTVREGGNRTASSAGYRVDAPTARALAAGGEIDVEVFYDGEYHRHRAARTDLLE